MKLATLANAAVVHTQRWVEHFRSRGHDVRLYSLEPAPAGLAAIRLPNLPLPGLVRYPLALPALQRELAAFAPDVVDAHFVPNYGVLAALAGRHPLSIAAWGSDLLLAARRDVLQRARARFALTRADLVLCDAENLAAAARAAGAPAERVRALPWGVDRARFVPAGARERGLMVSTRMHEDVYDLPTLLAGIAPVLAAHPHANLVLAGDGSRRRALEALAAERLPAGRFRFVGMLAADALAALLGRAELYLSASLSDSTSQSLLEAMAAGALPVVSDLAGNREWLGEGARGGGQLFAAGDAAGLTRAATAALGDASWADAARARNAAVIAARGDWHVNLARIEALFTALAAGRGLPAVEPA
jgi:glycosyltransferase involved in cell wall biosynthesis